ncbi:hypothetical protein [Actinacidiphila sp. ITFR-21]|uniref:hypothetical protein n=1 Tax=Actinacidiphila sp. ITFR-21 TaxID=3075199 RepID=UPI0028891622|nr:hypothetical protein [Streptomyces sp. ITFR-21]WNI16924.1 hypothetical protein RLT57_16270 [Streptomyces sp. ITFR-21]
MEPLDLPPGYMSAHQAATTLGITLGGIRELRRRGRLTAVGGSPRQPYYDTEQVLALLAERAAA